MSQFAFDMGGKTAQEAVNDQQEDMLVSAGRHTAALTKIESFSKQREGAAPGVMNINLKLTFTIQDGPARGRTVTKFVSSEHSSEIFVRNSRAFIGGLAAALGHGDGVIDSLDPFLNKLVDLDVIVQKPKEGSPYGPSNDIRRCYSAGSGKNAPMPAAKAAPKAPPKPAPKAAGVAPAGKPGFKPPQRVKEQVAELEDAVSGAEAEFAGADGDAGAPWQD